MRPVGHRSGVRKGRAARRIQTGPRIVRRGPARDRPVVRDVAGKTVNHSVSSSKDGFGIVCACAAAARTKSAGATHPMEKMCAVMDRETTGPSMLPHCHAFSRRAFAVGALLRHFLECRRPEPGRSHASGRPNLPRGGLIFGAFRRGTEALRTGPGGGGQWAEAAAAGPETELRGFWRRGGRLRREPIWRWFRPIP